MNRINLIIADTDQSYLDSLANYMLNNHSKWFQISTFSNKENLIKSLEASTNMIDILLIGPNIYSEDLPLNKVKSTLILSSGRVVEECSDLTIINKYQSAEMLVSDILRNYSEKSSGEIINMTGDKKTKVIGIYSPSGGVGKSSLAVNLSVQCASTGMSIFYLNLEDINSTHNYFIKESDQNFSNVLFYIKGKSKNLGMKIDSLKSVDASNVNYFSVQDSVFEIDEMLPEEINNLIAELVKISHYDIIFVDMSSILNKRNMNILKICDKFIYLLTSDSVVEEKVKVLEKDLERSLSNINYNISDKMILVANKCNYNSTWIDNYVFQGNTVKFKLPFENNFKANSLNNSPRFNSEINKMINDIK